MNNQLHSSLGKTFTDRVTGFTGVCTARIEYITGCVHLGIQPAVDKEGKLPSMEYFDESRLKSESYEAVKLSEGPNGGPSAPMKRPNL